MPPQPGPYGPYPPHGRGPYRPPQPHAPLLRRLSADEWPPLRELLRGTRGQGRGCLWMLMLFTCAGGVILPLMAGYPLLRSGHNKARRVFPREHHRIVEPDVIRAQQARAWTAAAMSFVILTVYGRPEDIEQAQQQYFLRLGIAPWLLLLSAPAVVALLLRWAVPEARQAMRRNLRAAGRSALWYFGTATCVPLLLLLGFGVSRFAQDAGPTARYLAFGLMCAELAALVWAGGFLVFATGPAVRGAFNTAQVHAALPALLTGVMVWEFTAISVVIGGPPPGPPLVQIAALIGGPASVTAVAWWEIHRLRTRHGVVLRGAA
ncbi:hypothetical protein AB0K92_24865 [Streptomyces sp. NPDC052687]|uniref:hypothetical protein n=1 Tax=Streptomyces sp. NPDC052687 TaxID=3154759 RepID=UPI0034282CA9